MAFHLILALFTLFIIERQIEGERVESRTLEFWITEIWSIRPTPGIPRLSEVITHGSCSNEHGCSQLQKQKEDWCLLTQFCWKAGRCKPSCSSTLDGFPGPPFAFISFPISSNCDGEGRKHARQSWVLKHANWNEISLMFPVSLSFDSLWNHGLSSPSILMKSGSFMVLWSRPFPLYSGASLVSLLCNPTGTQELPRCQWTQSP